MLLQSGTSLLTSLSCSCDCAQLTGQPCQDGERLSPSLWRPEATYISLCRPASPANVWNCSCSSKTLLGHLSRLERRVSANRCCVAEQYSVFLKSLQSKKFATFLFFWIGKCFFKYCFFVSPSTSASCFLKNTDPVKRCVLYHHLKQKFIFFGDRKTSDF